MRNAWSIVKDLRWYYIIVCKCVCIKLKISFNEETDSRLFNKANSFPEDYSNPSTHKNSDAIMAEAADLVLGIVSLAGLFTTCVDCF